MATPIRVSQVKLDGQGNAILANPPGPFGPPELTDDAAYDKHLCACCSQPGCNLWCAGCDIKKAGKIRTFYCSRECQEKHHPDHKVDCSTRRHVARAATMLYSVFEAFEKATHVYAKSKVVEKDKVVTIGLTEEDLRPWTGASVFLKFPEDALPEGTPKELMTSILLDRTYGEVFTTARPLLSYFMQPFCKTFEVATAPPKNLARLIVDQSVPRVAGSTPVCLHSVIKICAGNSEEYALDLTGIQFGWTDILYDWNTFVEHRFESAIEVKPLLEESRDEYRDFSNFPLNTVNGAQLVLRRVVMGRLVHELKVLINLMYNSDGPDGRYDHIDAYRKLVKTRDVSLFSTMSMRLLGPAMHLPRRLVLNLENIGRMYMSDDFDARVALSMEEAARYADVWFKEGDERVAWQNLEQLKDIWEKRMEKPVPMMRVPEQEPWQGVEYWV